MLFIYSPGLELQTPSSIFFTRSWWPFLRSHESSNSYQSSARLRISTTRKEAASSLPSVCTLHVICSWIKWLFGKLTQKRTHPVKHTHTHKLEYQMPFGMISQISFSYCNTFLVFKLIDLFCIYSIYLLCIPCTIALIGFAHTLYLH